MGFNGLSTAQTVRRLMEKNRSTYKGAASNSASAVPGNHPKHSELDREVINDMLKPRRAYGIRPRTKLERAAGLLVKTCFWGFLAFALYRCARL